MTVSVFSRCCESSCADDDGSLCGTYDYYCLDPAYFDPHVVAEFPDCTADWRLIGDGRCNAESNNVACGYDGGDCCKCTCTTGRGCDSLTSYLNCVDPGALDGEFYGCNEPPSLQPCSTEAQRTWVVEDAAQARALSDTVNCSGGTFVVEWRGNVIVDEPIYVSDGTVLSVSGADSGAVIDGNWTTRIFVVFNATLHTSNINITRGFGLVGGGVAAKGSVLKLNRTSFIENWVEGNGGALFVSDDSNVSSEGVNFVRNWANTDGGAVFVNGSSMISHGGSWASNTARNNGGAVCVSFNSNASLRNDEFDDNFSWNSGGAIMLKKGSYAAVDNGIFSRNRAGAYGGAVASAAFDPLAADSILVLTGVTTFANGLASNGGALALRGGLSLEIDTADALFDSNTASTAGGAVFVTGAGVGPTFLDVSFVSNSAQLGGAVSLTASGNTVSAEGVDYSTTFERCRFLENKATNAGGAIESVAGDDYYINSVFEGNTARGGGALRLAGKAAISNCSFVDNVSEEGEGAAVANIGSIEMETSYFSGNAFHCPPDTFLDYTAVRDGLSTAASLFLECLSCNFLPILLTAPSWLLSFIYCAD